MASGTWMQIEGCDLAIDDVRGGDRAGAGAAGRAKARA
jgi:hypothetical protein